MQALHLNVWVWVPAYLIPIQIPLNRLLHFNAMACQAQAIWLLTNYVYSMIPFTYTNIMIFYLVAFKKSISKVWSLLLKYYFTQTVSMNQNESLVLVKILIIFYRDFMILKCIYGFFDPKFMYVNLVFKDEIFFSLSILFLIHL